MRNSGKKWDATLLSKEKEGKKGAMKFPHLTGHQTLIVPIFFVSIIFFGVWGKAPNLEFIPSPNLNPNKKI
ncbi:hypothetical protein BSPWISOXPB_2917 [uncultured Gammaproteobacteria bacterium]|nr:hypothetical protein BSPWISOXPB_2917 [uncultured Gammaproteobacteria bacterium]